jgi:hypothetical protein
MEDSAPTSAPSVVWHIVWQVTPGRDLLASAALAGRIRARLLGAHRRPGRELLHYLLTPTEMHLLSRLPAGESPGDVARAIGNIVARWVRQAQCIAGLVFCGRYRAYPVESDASVRDEFRVLAWRPVSLGLCCAPTHHASSSLRTTLGLSRVDGFNLLNPLRLFGDGVPEARNALRGAIARRPSVIEMRRWELARGMVLARVADGTFSSGRRPLSGLAASLVATSQPQGVDGALLLLQRWVSSKLGLKDGDGLAARHSPAGARVRALVAMLAVQLDLCSAAAAARHFRRAKATLSERMAACRHAPEDQAILRLPLRRIVAEAIDLREPSPPRPAEVIRPRMRR